MREPRRRSFCRKSAFAAVTAAGTATNGIDYFDTAESYVGRALELAPERPWLWVERSCVYQAQDQTEQALVLRFGQAINIVREPGLYFKLPFVDGVVRIDKRILALDLPEQEVIASDQKRRMSR